MKNASAHIPLLLLFLLPWVASCGVVQPVTGADNTRVEVRTVTETVHDTAWVELPVIVEKVATLDTASVLENKYAKSAASVSGGVLHHSLQTKPVREPVSVETKIVYRDSLVYRDRIRTETVEVERKLSSWQAFKMKTGGLTLTILLIAVIYITLSIILKLKPL
ncbi:MAG: hypothetical protein IJQ69_05020 [Bacteroidales bacterium]|nr:hypothetical protein [Bacteroidales bacterium]